MLFPETELRESWLAGRVINNRFLDPVNDARKYLIGNFNLMEEEVRAFWYDLECWFEYWKLSEGIRPPDKGALSTNVQFDELPAYMCVGIPLNGYTSLILDYLIPNRSVLFSRLLGQIPIVFTPALHKLTAHAATSIASR